MRRPKSLKKRACFTALREAADWLYTSFLFDAFFVGGFLIGSLLMFLIMAPHVMDESCEATYPTLALWKDRAWAFLEVRVLHLHWYSLLEYEQEAVTKVIKEEALKVATGNTGVAAPTSIGAFVLFWVFGTMHRRAA